MSETKRQVSAEELIRMAYDGFRYELVKGELIQMTPAGGEHGVTTMRLGARLEIFVEDHDLGVICAAETGFIIAHNPDTVRAPDVAFVSKARIPADGIPKGYWPFAPDMALEVISPNDNFGEVDEMIGEWLEAGVRLVVIINPRKRNIKLYRSQTEINLLTEADELKFDDIVPGFSYPVKKLF
jgi:Uma2 family endonuclease